MKNLFILILITFSFNLQAQKNVIDLSNTSEEEFYDISDSGINGWALLKHPQFEVFANLSNKDYILFANFNCMNADATPKILIEYSKYYREGGREGLDLLSTNKDESIEFWVDGKNYINPFKNKEDINAYTNFLKDLKSADKLTVKLFNIEYNPITEKEELTLNRSIDFTLENSEVLDTPINCSF